MAGTSYTFTYTVESDLWDGSNPITVVVKNDQIIEATDANDVEPDGAFTVRDFFARAERVAGTGGEIEIVLDPEWQYPTFLRIDRLPDDTADDRTIRIIDFVNDETPEPGVEFETIDFRSLGEGLATRDFSMASVIRSQVDVASLDVGSDVDWASVDFETQVVLRFDLSESTSCQFKDMDELRYDANHAVVYPEVPTSGGRTCTSDAGLYRVLVVVDRDDLPMSKFTLGIGPFLPATFSTVEVIAEGSLR